MQSKGKTALGADRSASLDLFDIDGLADEVVILCGKGITGKREALQLCRNFQQRAAKALGDSHVVVQNVKATEAAVLDSMGHSQEARACLTDACEIAGAPTGGVSALGEEFGALSSSDAEAQGEEAEGEDGDEEPVTEHEEAVLCSLKETVAELLEAEKTRQAAVLISEVQALLFEQAQGKMKRHARRRNTQSDQGTHLSSRKASLFFPLWRDVWESLQAFEGTGSEGGKRSPREFLFLEALQAWAERKRQEMRGAPEPQAARSLLEEDARGEGRDETKTKKHSEGEEFEHPETDAGDVKAETHKNIAASTSPLQQESLGVSETTAAPPTAHTESSSPPSLATSQTDHQPSIQGTRPVADDKKIDKDKTQPEEKEQSEQTAPTITLDEPIIPEPPARHTRPTNRDPRPIRGGRRLKAKPKPKSKAKTQPQSHSKAEATVKTSLAPCPPPKRPPASNKPKEGEQVPASCRKLHDPPASSHPKSADLKAHKQLAEQEAPQASKEDETGDFQSAPLTEDQDNHERKAEAEGGREAESHPSEDAPREGDLVETLPEALGNIADLAKHMSPSQFLEGMMKMMGEGPEDGADTAERAEAGDMKVDTPPSPGEADSADFPKTSKGSIEARESLKGRLRTKPRRLETKAEQEERERKQREKREELEKGMSFEERIRRGLRDSKFYEADGRPREALARMLPLVMELEGPAAEHFHNSELHLHSVFRVASSLRSLGNFWEAFDTLASLDEMISARKEEQTPRNVGLLTAMGQVLLCIGKEKRAALVLSCGVQLLESLFFMNAAGVFKESNDGEEGEGEEGGNARRSPSPGTSEEKGKSPEMEDEMGGGRDWHKSPSAINKLWEMYQDCASALAGVYVKKGKFTAAEELFAKVYSDVPFGFLLNRRPEW